MPLDASIYSRFAAPRSALEYAGDFAQLDAMKSQQQDNALARAFRTQELGERQGAAQRANALRELQRSLADRPEAEVIQGLRGAGYFGEAQAMEKAGLERQKLAAEVSNKEQATAGLALEQQIKRRQDHVSKLAGVSDVPSAVQWINEAVAAGELPMQRATQVIQGLQSGQMQFGEWRQRALMGGLSALDQVRQQLEQQKAAETAANNARVDDRIRAEGAANRAVTMRGQNMVDARQREVNTITKTEKEAQRKEAATEKAVTKFSDTLQKEGIPEIEAALSGAESIFKRYTDPKTGKVGDMPGIGAITNVLPDWAVSSEGKDVRESLQSVANIVLAARSGAAVTDQELRRLARELSNSLGSSAADMQRAYGKFRTRFEQVKANAAAGVSDDVKAVYEERGGVPIQRGGAKSSALTLPSADAIAAELARRGGK